MNRTELTKKIFHRLDNPQDFKRMCRSCHWKYDKKHLNFKGAKGGKGKRGTRLLP